MPGLFIQQLAGSLSNGAEIAVLYASADPNCPNDFELEYSNEKGVEVVRVYYTPAKNPAGKWMKFYRAHKRGLDFLKGFNPDVIHANILTRVGLVGFLFSLRLKVPYVITEHWSRYFPGNDTYKGLFRKIITRFVASRAAALIAVSDSLKSAMQDQGITNRDFRVVPNGVDMKRFTLAEEKNDAEIKQIIHVSCFEDRSKNISGLLHVLRELSGTRSDFICRFVGEGPDLERLKQLAGSLGFPEGMIRFEGLVEGDVLADLVRKSDFSVLSSNYETFGTVVIESLACGVPVVATNVGVVPTVINKSNGVVVAPGDPNALYLAINYLMDHCREYDKKEVRDSVYGKFSLDSVASEVMGIYRHIIKNHV